MLIYWCINPHIWKQEWHDTIGTQLCNGFQFQPLTYLTYVKGKQFTALEDILHTAISKSKVNQQVCVHWHLLLLSVNLSAWSKLLGETVFG